MRKLILVTAIVLSSTAAFAGGQRGLSMPQPAVQQATEQQRPVHRAEVTVLPGPTEQPAVTTPPPSMEEKLKAAGELKPDGTPVPAPQPQIQSLAQPAPAPTPTPVPVQARASVKERPLPDLVVTPEPARRVAQAPAPARHVEHAQKPAKKRVARRGESTEHKARRIAAQFGVYW